MIKKYMITGDTHSNFSRFYPLFNNDWGIQADYPPDETGIIILGDAALNYLLNENDKFLKGNSKIADILGILYAAIMKSVHKM